MFVLLHAGVGVSETFHGVSARRRHCLKAVCLGASTSSMPGNFVGFEIKYYNIIDLLSLTDVNESWVYTGVKYPYFPMDMRY